MVSFASAIGSFLLISSALAAAAPVIDSISPTSGPAGAVIAITGSGFDATGNLVTGPGGGKYLDSSNNRTQISYIVPDFSKDCVGATQPCDPRPPIKAGDYQVSVTSSGGASNSKTFTLNSAPVIASISPTSGPAGASITITGSGFTATGNTVSFGASGSLNLSYSSDGTTIVFSVPSGYAPGHLTAPGAYPVSVTNANGMSNAQQFTLTNPPQPTLTNPTATQQNPEIIKVNVTNPGNGSGSVAAFATSSNYLPFNNWSGDTCTGRGYCFLNGIIPKSAKVVIANFNVPTCEFVYSAWSACQLDGYAYRAVTGYGPSGCQGGSPVIQLPCSPVTSAATSTCSSQSVRSTFILQNFEGPVTPSTGGSTGGFWGSLFGSIGSAITGAVGSIGTVAAAIGTAMGGLLGNVVGAVTQLMGGVLSIPGHIVSAIGNIIGSDTLKSVGAAMQVPGNAVQQAGVAIGNATDNMTDAIFKSLGIGSSARVIGASTTQPPTQSDQQSVPLTYKSEVKDLITKLKSYANGQLSEADAERIIAALPADFQFPVADQIIGDATLSSSEKQQYIESMTNPNKVTNGVITGSLYTKEQATAAANLMDFLIQSGVSAKDANAATNKIVEEGRIDSFPTVSLLASPAVDPLVRSVPGHVVTTTGTAVVSGGTKIDQPLLTQLKSAVDVLNGGGLGEGTYIGTDAQKAIAATLLKAKQEGAIVEKVAINITEPVLGGGAGGFEPFNTSKEKWVISQPPQVGTSQIIGIGSSEFVRDDRNFLPPNFTFTITAGAPTPASSPVVAGTPQETSPFVFPQIPTTPGYYSESTPPPSFISCP